MRTPKTKTSDGATTAVVTNLTANFTPADADLSPFLKFTGDFMSTGLLEVKRCVATEDMAEIVPSLVGE